MGPITMNSRMKDRIDELLHLIEAEPEALRKAEFLQTQTVLEDLVGKSVDAATVDETRVTIATSDGCRYYFYGFLGSEKP
jgi:hypothetical protein